MQVVAQQPQIPAACAEVLQQLGPNVFHDPALVAALGRVAVAMLIWAHSARESQPTEAATAETQVNTQHSWL